MGPQNKDRRRTKMGLVQLEDSTGPPLGSGSTADSQATALNHFPLGASVSPSINWE